MGVVHQQLTGAICCEQKRSVDHNSKTADASCKWCACGHDRNGGAVVPTNTLCPRAIQEHQGVLLLVRKVAEAANLLHGLVAGHGAQGVHVRLAVQQRLQVFQQTSG